MILAAATCVCFARTRWPWRLTQWWECVHALKTSTFLMMASPVSPTALRKLCLCSLVFFFCVEERDREKEVDLARVTARVLKYDF